MANPTLSQFRALQKGYEYFNRVLFSKELPAVILNLSRKSKAAGFVAPFRWRAAEDTDGQGKIHELSINPAILLESVEYVYSTLVHEQVHIWQFAFGKPSRRGYHNREWADKMERVGLIPSSTGAPGGARTGQNMSDYPEPGGLFLKALLAMPEAFKLPFVSVEGLRSAAGGGNGTPKPKNKVKYSCPDCAANVWGKRGLNLICGNCHVSYEESD